MKFEWDSEKERINIQKHGITFDQAAYVLPIDDIEYVRIISARKATKQEQKQGVRRNRR